MEVPLQYYSCPLCCSNTFDSKQSLLEHLIHISLNIVCTVCNHSFSSLELLTEHLKGDKCDALKPENVGLSNDLCNIVKIEHDANSVNSSSTQDNVVNTKKIYFKTSKKNISNIKQGKCDGKIYVELLRQQLTKPCLQTQEIKLVKEDGQSRYMILTDEESILNPEDVTIVTKQNNDGTISLSAHNEIQVDPFADIENKPVANNDDGDDKTVEELYSCNTCGVSFSSVVEHIQNYHTDEDVVVHDGNPDLTLECDSVESDETAVDKQSLRRMITEAGNIVETPVLQEQEVHNDESYPRTEMMAVAAIKVEPNERSRQMLIGRLQVDAAPKPKNEIKNNVYHKVLMKEVQTTGGQIVKLYNCMTCNLYVTSLTEFKNQPCKVCKFCEAKTSICDFILDEMQKRH